MFEHYRYFDTNKGDKPDLLKEIVAERLAREASELAERQRTSHLSHKARMEGFRAWVRRQTHLVPDEKAEMIKASFSW